MRKIVRPDSTTIFIEFPFHVIKNIDEMNNIFDLYGVDKFFPVMRAVDLDSFEPLVYGAIPIEGKGFAEWPKYVVSLTVSQEAKAVRDENFARFRQECLDPA